MYCEFFGLKTAPFNNTPDPRFFYNTPDHEEALASLIYAVEQRKGFVLVTGEVGSGKTLLSRLLLNRFDDSIQSAVLTHTRLTGREFLLAICREFELEVERDATAAELTNCLEEFLLKQYARDRLAVVILDEAQSLPVDSLEELRMLGNLEADDAKLLQVVILGQPELQDAFRSPALKQTYQRIFRTFHLGGLDRDLTAGYIARRLAIAGLAEGRQIFDPDAVDAIFQHSGGIPRMINQICDNALLAAYSDSRKRISARIIHDVVKQMMSLGETGRGEAVSGAKSPVPPSIDSGVGEGIPAGRTPPTGSSRGREDAGLLKHMAERLAAFEEELRAVKQDRPSPITLSLDETLDIEGVQQMRRDAEALLREVRKTSQDAERHIQDVLEKTRRSAQSAQVRARAEAKAAEKHNTTVQEQIREKLEGIREIADGQEARITQVVSQGKSEVEAIAELRRQASDLFEQITNSQKESDRRFHEAITEAAESRRDMEVRLEKAIADSCAVSDRLESRAGTFLEDARTHTATIQNQLETLISEVRARGDAAQARTTELLAQQRTDVDAARRRIDEFAGRMDSHSARVDRESREILDCLKDEAKGIVEQIHQVRDRSQSRAEAVSVRMEEVLGEMESRIQSSHDKISDLVSNAETEMRTACVSLQSAREQILSEAEDSRWQATEHLEETRSLLSDTRDQCGTLLGDLREQIDEQTEKAETIWRASAERGSKTLSELNEKLLEARKLTDHSRSELESLVRSATGELASARSALESSLGDQKAQIAQLSEDAGAIKLDFQERFDEARAALDARITGMESETSERIERAESEASDKVRKIKAEIEAQCDESVGLVSNALQQLGERVAQAETGAKGRIDLLTAELAAIIRQHSERAAARVCEIATQADARMNEAHSEASKKVQALQADLAAASEAADRIRSDLAQALDAMQRDAAHCRGRFEKEAEQFERKLLQLIERNRVALQEARTQVEILSHQAGETTESMQNRLEAIKNEAQTRVAQIGAHLETTLSEAMDKADALRAETDTITTDVADRMSRTHQEAETTLVEAEEATRSLRQHSKSSLAEVRSCLSQMNERAEVLRRDLSHMGDDIRGAAETTTEQVESAGQRVAERIESLRESAQRDADANNERLAAIKQQVEKSSEQMRQNASKLLDQVQSGATALREHANQLLDQARTSSEKLNESAAYLLMQAQTSAEQFREQAEKLLHHAEVTATDVRGEVQTLQSEVSREAKQIQQQIVGMKNDMAESRRESAQITAEAAETHKNAQAQSRQLLQRAETVQRQTEALLAIPNELVKEARSRGTALAEMSKKISMVVEKLSKEGQSAGRKQQALKKAGNQADDKLKLLKHHTERVGQLVGIIRQLYGTMDARIERLRGRLTQVDDLVRNVPREIESLRAAFDDSVESVSGGAEDRQSRLTSEQVASRSASKPASGPPARSPSPRPVRKPGNGRGVDSGSQGHGGPAGGGAPSSTVPVSNHSLGQLVQRNQELNTWLKEVIGEEALEGKLPAQLQDRASNTTARAANTP